jgi:hypothetical protein
MPTQTESGRPKRTTGQPLGDLLCVALLFFLCLSFGLARYRSGIDLADEGCLAYGAVRVMDGQVPNRDFTSLQPPLSFYAAAAMFKLFGTSLVSLRILGLSIYILVPLLIYGLSRNVAGRGVSLTAALPASVLGISHFLFVPLSMWQGITACLAAALLYLRATQGGRHSHLMALLAGCLTGASMLLRQDQGVYLAIALVAYAAALRYARHQPLPSLSTPRSTSSKPSLLFWLAGIATVLLPFGLYWGAQGALPSMFKQLIVFPVTTYVKTSSLPFPPFRSCLTFGPDAIVILYYLPPALDLIIALWLLKRLLRRSFYLREARITFLLAWSALFYCQVLARSDVYHLLITLAPFLVLCAGCWPIFLEALGDLVGRLARIQSAAVLASRLASLLAGAAVMCLLLVTRPVFLAPPVPATETLLLERAGIRKTGAANFKKFVERVQSLAPPDRPILCLPYQPMFYFLCNRRNPTRWNYLWPGDQTPEEHQDLISQARSDPPAAVVLTGEEDLRRYAPAIVDFVQTDYRLAAQAGGLFTIYAPKNGAQPASVPPLH